MKLHADSLSTYCISLTVGVAYGLWVVHQGMDTTVVLTAGCAWWVIFTAAYLVRMKRMERKRARQLEESRQGFPWRRFANGGAVGVAFIGLFAVDGWDKASLEVAAILIFGIGTAGFVVEWLIQRWLPAMEEPGRSKDH
ncbi:MAG TPA: hypothetical protein VG028_02295 [Terriglobia bacterium]|nr:hypothetical protein [Terriglobia bacterium]